MAGAVVLARLPRNLSSDVGRRQGANCTRRHFRFPSKYPGAATMVNRNLSTSLMVRSAKKPNLEFAVLLKQLKVLMAVKRTTTAPSDEHLHIFLCDRPEPSEPGVEILNFITPPDLEL